MNPRAQAAGIAGVLAGLGLNNRAVSPRPSRG